MALSHLAAGNDSSVFACRPLYDGVLLARGHHRRARLAAWAWLPTSPTRCHGPIWCSAGRRPSPRPGRAPGPSPGRSPTMDRIVSRVSGGRTSVPRLMAGLPVLVLTTTGRRSGQPRASHLIAVPFADTLALIGTNFGQPHTPAWVLNLEAQPRAAVTYRGVTRDVVARPATCRRVGRGHGRLGRGLWRIPEVPAADHRPSAADLHPRLRRPRLAAVREPVGIAGVVAALSVTSDLTRGHPPGEAMRACLLATELAQRCWTRRRRAAPMSSTQPCSGTPDAPRRRTRWPPRLGGNDVLVRARGDLADTTRPTEALRLLAGLGQGVDRVRLLSNAVGRRELLRRRGPRRL